LLNFPRAQGPPTTDDRRPLAELLAKAGDKDFLRVVAESVLQLMMEADVEGLIGAGRFERSLETRLGTFDRKIPKLRPGSYFPGYLERRRLSALPTSPPGDPLRDGRKGARRGDPGLKARRSTGSPASRPGVSTILSRPLSDPMIAVPPGTDRCRWHRWA
jgi:hypothetical protein